MSYLKSDGADTVVSWPYSYAQLRRDNPDVSFPREVDDAWLAGYDIYKVAPTSQPAYDLTKNIVEGQPQRIAGVWTQVWTQVPASLEEIVARTKQADDAQAKFDVAADAFVQTFIGMTKEQVENYTANNTATVAAVRDLMIKQNLMLWVLARQEFGQ